LIDKLAESVNALADLTESLNRGTDSQIIKIGQGQSDAMRLIGAQNRSMILFLEYISTNPGDSNYTKMVDISQRILMLVRRADNK